LTKLREIERLRGVAILLVMVFHWEALQKLLPDVVTHGWSGVDLFFVISGYVVTLSLVRLLPPIADEQAFVDAFARAKVALRTFYTRRFFRIIPAAVVGLLLDRFLMTLAPQHFGAPFVWIQEVIAFFSGVYNYALPYNPEYQMYVYWSLAVEEHFYLMLPVLFVACRTTNRRLLACLVIGLISISCRALPHPAGLFDDGGYERLSSHLRFDSLMAGVALALVSVKGAPSPRLMSKRLMRFVLLPGAAAMIACAPAVIPEHVMHREGFIGLWLLSGLLVGFGSLDSGYVFSFPVVGRVLEHIGTRSYALYLVHTLTGHLETYFGEIWPRYRELVPADVEYPWRRAVALFVLVLVIAELMHRLVERPFMRVGSALTDPARRASFKVSTRTKVLVAAGAAVALLYASRHVIMRVFGPRDLALHAPVTMSSHEEHRPGGEVLVNGWLESEYGAHTRRQESPWVTIDLGRPTKVGAIRVYNRAEGWQDEQIPLELSVSNDGARFTTIARTDTMFTQAFPWRIAVRRHPFRYLRLQAPGNTALCLSEVEAFQEEWMAQMP
jgi:peptidoglycan/LPS O-acetylase OafA/YrhL